MENFLAKALGQDASPSSVTERRDLLERLLARLAHEVRNPLSSIDIHAQLLEEDLATLAPEQRAQFTPRLGIIRGELHRLERIVEQFLRLASPSAVDLEPVSLPKLVNHVCALLRPEAAARQIEISAQAPETLPPVMADSVRVTQALLNLLINAVQAVGRNGHVELTVGTENSAAIIWVRDTGPGIPPEELPVIFDPFYSTKPEGSGLGLWIAQQIVTAHGGTLRAENAPEGGAVFTMTLPLNLAP